MVGSLKITPPGKKSFFARLFGEDNNDMGIGDLEIEQIKEETARYHAEYIKSQQRQHAASVMMGAEAAEDRARRIQAEMSNAQNSYNNMVAAQNSLQNSLQNTLGGQAGLLGGMGNHNNQNAMTPGPVTYSVMEKLLMRMNVPRNERHEFDYLQAVDNPAKENVIVFIIVRGEPITLDDDRALFPSDGLIARINLLRK